MRKVRDVLVAVRPDMRLTITLWDETFLFPVFGDINASHQIYARKSTHELFREAGIDVALYKDEPGIGIDMTTGCTRDRGGHGKSPAGGINLPPEATSMYRDFDFLDEETAKAFHERSAPGAFLFNCWIEAWGEHVWQQCDAGDPNLPALADMDGKTPDGILHINSRYPPDGVWWESQLRIVPTMLGGIHFMEPYAHAVAEHDAVRITRGGLFLDKTHSADIQRFARAFQALPAERFSTVGDSTDPVAVRTLARGDIRYVYAVNREYYPVSTTITLDKAVGEVKSLDTGEAARWETKHDVKLGPYELRAFSMHASVALVGAATTIPREVEDQLVVDANAAVALLARVRSSGTHVPGTDELIKGIEHAIDKRRFAWLRRALSCYVVRKCQLLDKEPASSK